MGEIADVDVIRLARQTGRVIIRLDRDFALLQRRASALSVSVVYLRLPNTHRRFPALAGIVTTFLMHHLDLFDMDAIFVTVTPNTVISTPISAMQT